MSWDVLLLDPPPGAAVDDLEEDAVRPLGSLADVHAALLRAWPALDLSDPRWGRLEAHAIEVNLGQEEPVTSIMLHVRGGDEAVGAILTLCAATGWRALDVSTGDWLGAGADPTTGIRAWRAYRDDVLGPD